MLAEQADIIDNRFQREAQIQVHTIINDYGKFALHTSIRVFYGPYNQYYRKWCSTGCTEVLFKEVQSIMLRSGSSDAEDSGI